MPNPYENTSVHGNELATLGNLNSRGGGGGGGGGGMMPIADQKDLLRTTQQLNLETSQAEHKNTLEQIALSRQGDLDVEAERNKSNLGLEVERNKSAKDIQMLIGEQGMAAGDAKVKGEMALQKYLIDEQNKYELGKAKLLQDSIVIDSASEQSSLLELQRIELNQETHSEKTLAAQALLAKNSPVYEKQLREQYLNFKNFSDGKKAHHDMIEPIFDSLQGDKNGFNAKLFEQHPKAEGFNLNVSNSSLWSSGMYGASKAGESITDIFTGDSNQKVAIGVEIKVLQEKGGTIANDVLSAAGQVPEMGKYLQEYGDNFLSRPISVNPNEYQIDGAWNKNSANRFTQNLHKEILSHGFSKMGKPLNGEQLEHVSNLSGLLLNSSNTGMSSGANKELLLNEVKKASQNILGNSESYPELLDILLTSTQNGASLSAGYAEKLKTDHKGMFGEGSIVNAAMSTGYKQLGQVNKILKSISTSELTYANVSKLRGQMDAAFDPNKPLQGKVINELLTSPVSLNKDLIDPQYSSGSTSDVFGKVKGAAETKKAAAGLSSETEEFLKLQDAQATYELKNKRDRGKIGMKESLKRGEVAKTKSDLILDEMLKLNQK